METEIISDEDIADVTATKKVAEIFFGRLLEMYLQFERRFFWIYFTSAIVLDYFECA
ncbi:hypothetical protein PIB30_041781 [Stylosanthes scabra]|uniref:Uncharacterized protein n=1 Tax=Stylosanthes scabra TaxID=79078 RepID=A0ABU6VDH3_9FABA|nr:hypothetical protein [Stylosanthes scabra]